jgi:hypothetical protein
MLDPVHYSVRRHAFEKERRWTVDGTGLAWQAEDSSGRLAYSDIASIRLDYGATRADFARFRCHVTGRTGTYTVVSSHFDGPGSFSDRRDTYAPFVRTLIVRTAAANPRCRFHAGVSPARFWATALLLFVSLIVLATAVLSLGVPALWYLYLKIAVLIVLLPVAFIWIKRNRPRRFQPSAIPADVLPGP